jgi:hypothetical protein
MHYIIQASERFLGRMNRKGGLDTFVSSPDDARIFRDAELVRCYVAYMRGRRFTADHGTDPSRIHIIEVV